MKKVLIVDDSLFMRQSLKSILASNGFEVVGEAVDGAAAVEKYKEIRPDIVTMDITMPTMDGVQAVAEIKKFDPECKVVMISAVGQESNVKKSVMQGAKSFIVKPFKEEHLIKVLNSL